MLHSYGGTKHDRRSEFAITEMLLHDVDISKGSRLYIYTQDNMASEKDKIKLGKAPVTIVSRGEAEKMQFCEICDNVLVDCIKSKSSSTGRPCAYCPCNDCNTTAQLRWANGRITDLEYQKQAKHIMWESGQDRIEQLEDNLSIKDAQLLEMTEEAARVKVEVAALTKELELTQIKRDNLLSENTDLRGRLLAAMVRVKGRRSAQRKVQAISRVPARRQPGSAAKQAHKALQQASSKAAMQCDTAGVPVPKATLLKKKQQPAPGKLLAITQHGEPQGKRKRAIDCQEGSGLMTLYTTTSPTPAPYLPSQGSPMPARAKEMLLLDYTPFNNWLPDEDISGIEKDVTNALDINMDALGDVPEVMDPEAELADFMPHNNTILLLEGPKAATSTCDNTNVLRMEGPMADDACAWNIIEVLDISTNSLGEMPDMSEYMAELDDLISASHVSTCMGMHKTKDSGTVHANASLLADFFNIHKTPDAAPQKMDSKIGQATTGNSSPSALAGACHRRSAALSHFPDMSAVLCLGQKLPELIAGADQEPSTQLTHLRINDQGDIEEIHVLASPNCKSTTDCLMRLLLEDLPAMAPSRPSSASPASCMSDEIAVRNLPEELAQLPGVRIAKCSYNDHQWSTPAKPSTAAEVIARKKGWEAARKIRSRNVKASCSTEDFDMSAGEPSFAAAAAAASWQEAAEAPAAMRRHQRWLRESVPAPAAAASAPAISAALLRRALQATSAKRIASPSGAEQGAQEDKKHGNKAKTIKHLAQKAGCGCKKMAKGIKTGLQAICCFGKPRNMGANK